MSEELPPGYKPMLDYLADELERTDPEWCKEVGEALERFHASHEMTNAEIEAMLDAAHAEPFTDEQVERMMRKAGH